MWLAEKDYFRNNPNLSKLEGVYTAPFYLCMIALQDEARARYNSII